MIRFLVLNQFLPRSFCSDKANELLAIGSKLGYSGKLCSKDKTLVQYLRDFDPHLLFIYPENLELLNRSIDEVKKKSPLIMTVVLVDPNDDRLYGKIEADFIISLPYLSFREFQKIITSFGFPELNEELDLLFPNNLNQSQILSKLNNYALLAIAKERPWDWEESVEEDQIEMIERLSHDEIASSLFELLGTGNFPDKAKRQLEDVGQKTEKEFEVRRHSLRRRKIAAAIVLRNRGVEKSIEDLIS